MLSFINSTMTKIWKRMGRKAYRDGYVSAHISNTVAAQIVKLRTSRGWTQAQLAEQSGMKQSRISALEDPNWENVEVATLRRLASAFDVGLTVRFTPFSELARWAATLSEHKMLVPTFDEEASEAIATGKEDGAAAAFFRGIDYEQVQCHSVYDELQKAPNQIILPALPKSHNWAGALGALRSSSNEDSRPVLA